MYHHRRANSNPAKDDREDEKRMLPCRYFMAGFCQKGIRCKFYHPNIHARDPAYRVPELPSEFHMIPQYSQYEHSQGGPSLREMSSRGARSRRLKSMAGTQMGLGCSVSVSPPRGRYANGFKNPLTPSSHAYSQYLAYSQQQMDETDEDQIDEHDEISEEQKNAEQHTVFSHIDWSEFLAPGVRPPPPTQVPDQGSAISPVRMFDFGLPGLWRPDAPERPPKSVLKVANEDMPPEGSQVSGRGRMDHAAALLSSPRLSVSQKLSAKEELQMKVKQIAQELADEPIQHVRSLDSFFRNFKFNGFANSSSPLSASGITEDEVDQPSEANKENTVGPEEAETKTTEQVNGINLEQLSKSMVENPSTAEDNESNCSSL